MKNPNMIRPEWHELQRAMSGGYVKCSCGGILQTQQGIREHWQAGHFDQVNRTPEVTTPPPSQEVKELFHKLWGQAASGEYVKSDWIRLQVLLKC